MPANCLIIAYLVTFFHSFFSTVLIFGIVGLFQNLSRPIKGSTIFIVVKKLRLFSKFVILCGTWNSVRYVFSRGGTSRKIFASERAELSWPLSNGELSWAELFQIFNLVSWAEPSLARAERAKKRAQTENLISGMASWTSWILWLLLLCLETRNIVRYNVKTLLVAALE